MVPWVCITRHQARTVRVRPSDQDGRHSHDVRSQTSRDEFLDELPRGDDHLASEMSAFLRGGELVLEVNSGSDGLDHRLCDLERMERSTDAGLRGDAKRREPE